MSTDSLQLSKQIDQAVNQQHRANSGLSSQPSDKDLMGINNSSGFNSSGPTSTSSNQQIPQIKRKSQQLTSPVINLIDNYVKESSQISSSAAYTMNYRMSHTSQKFRLTLAEDPIFSISAPVEPTKQDKNNAHSSKEQAGKSTLCINCLKMKTQMSKKESCNFCGKFLCSSCGTKMRRSRAFANQETDDKYQVKRQNSKGKINRGKICRICDAKFILNNHLLPQRHEIDELDKQIAQGLKEEEAIRVDLFNIDYKVQFLNSKFEEEQKKLKKQGRLNGQPGVKNLKQLHVELASTKNVYEILSSQTKDKEIESQETKEQIEQLDQQIRESFQYQRTLTKTITELKHLARKSDSSSIPVVAEVEDMDFAVTLPQSENEHKEQPQTNMHEYLQAIERMSIHQELDEDQDLDMDFMSSRRGSEFTTKGEMNNDSILGSFISRKSSQFSESVCTDEDLDRSTIKQNQTPEQIRRFIEQNKQDQHDPYGENDATLRNRGELQKKKSKRIQKKEQRGKTNGAQTQACCQQQCNIF